MKKQIIFGIIIISGGLLVALGPQFLFRVCNAAEENFPRCYWSARAEIGAGIIITALGICVLLFLKEARIITGLSIGIFFTNITALFIPHALIGGCGMMSMRCRRVAFPALTTICVILLLCAIVNIFYIEMKNHTPVISQKNDSHLSS